MSVPVWVCASTAVCVCVCLLMIMMTVCRWLGTALALYADVCCRTLGALVKVLIWHIIVAEVAQQALVKYAHRTHGIRATKTLQKKKPTATYGIELRQEEREAISALGHEWVYRHGRVARNE